MVGSDSKVKDIRRFPPFAGLEEPQSDVKFSYSIGRENKMESNGWVDLQPVNNVVGPELSFARKVSAAIDAPIAVIKCAAGGTHLGGDWNPEQPLGFKMYPLALQLIQDSLAKLDQQKIKYRIEGFMWHQGENDARAGTPQNAYAGMFTELVDSLRDYGINAPVFVAVATICNNLGSDAIRSAQRGLPNAVEGVYPGADTDSLSDMHDRHDFCHFSQTGLVEHAALWNDSILSFEASKARTSKAAQTAKNPG